MRRSLVVVLCALCPLAIAACGSTKKASSSGSSTLRLAFQADMSVTDPDVFYDVEGNSVTLSTYEGLVRYAPDSTKIVGQLAKSWTVSPDRRTYTFALQDGVKFHDGTPMTSKSVKASIERRQAVKGGSSYMVADIDRITTPDDATVALHLDHPVGALLDYLASTWGPKVIGPAALVDHAGSDHSQKWLAEREDGTGPYRLTAFHRGTQYTMKAFAGYWAAKPFFKQVLISIVPNISSQQLQLRNGDLDVILHSYPPSDLPAAKGDSNLQVVEKPAFNRTILYVNTHRKPFSDARARAAMAAVIDVGKITQAVYGTTATPAAGPYPAGMLAGQPAPTTGGGTSAKGSGSLKLAYGPDAGGLLRSVAENIQIALQKLGYKVTLQGVQLPDTFEYAKSPATAPDLVLLTPVPDAAHPDTWAQPFWSSTGGINVLATKAPAIDRLRDEAAGAPAATAAGLYRTMGAQINAANTFISIADVKDTFVARRDLAGLQHSPAYEWLLTPAALSRR
ncbi:MAG: peptide/nickel transport system substrate-binding protein [Solirubrobacteraceae bacterium]|jgi:peptide/nickel transport system substrate-binding protein|nr:peptide/nickel transport system substrate-binding protein [Solirubrobacteraceae bacterium]